MFISYARLVYNIDMRTYLCPDYLKEDLLADLMDKEVLIGCRIIRPQSYLRELRKVENNHDIYEMYEIYKKLALRHLATSIEDVSFIKGVIKDRELCDFYDIDIDNLNIDEEYKIILKATPAFSPINYDAMDEDLYVVRTDLSPMMDDFIAELIKRGAKYHVLPTHQNTKQRFDVLNLRCGADAIARDIITKGYDLKDCAIYADNAASALLFTTMARYDISLDLAPSFKSSKASKILAIIDYYEKPNLENYRKLVSLRLLPIKDTAALLEYLENNAIDLDKPFERFSEDDKYYYYLERRAARAHTVYAELLKDIKACKDMASLLELAFKMVVTDDDESHLIKSCIERHREHLEEGKTFLISELKNLKVACRGELKVLAYNQETRAPYVYILDPNINNYPGLSAKKGLLDEDGLENTNYPSLKSRYQKAVKHFEHITSCAKITTFVFCQSTLDGKGVEYDIDRDNLPLAMSFYDQSPKRKSVYERKISDSSIFFKENDVLRGSVSSFETYLGCPYSYFLTYGLGLREAHKVDIDAVLVGDIHHKVFEELIKAGGKDYPNNADTAINEVLDTYRDRLYYIFPKKKVLIDAVIEKIAKSIKLELRFLKEAEASTDYSPIATEAEIDAYYYNDKDCKIYIRGFIDRIDGSGDNFRIIDYKTSDHSLSDDKIKTGKTLQLPTYGIMYSRISGKNLAGLFYLNADRKPINYKPYSFGFREGLKYTPYEEAFVQNEFINKHRLKGMVFLPDEGLDYGGHISLGRARTIKTAAYNYDDLVAIMDDLYKQIYDALKAGTIDLSPDEEACKYCRFKTICHFDGIKAKNRKISSEIEMRKFLDAVQ